MVQKKLSIIIKYLFAIMLFLIILSVSLLDKNIVNAFPNTVKCSAGGYLVISMSIMLVIKNIIRNYIYNDIKKETYIILLSIIGVIYTVIFVIVSMWAPILNGADFELCENQAINIANGGTFENNSYFIMYKNNVNITIIFAYIYRVFNSWRVVIIIGALCTNMSAFLASIIVYMILKNYFMSLLTYIIGGGILLLQFRSYIPYTDNYGMIFCLSLIFILLLKINNNIKVSLLAIVSLLGSWIKPTVIIIMIAIIIYIMLKTKFEFNNYFLNKMKELILTVIIILVSFSLINAAIYKKYKYNTNDDTWGASHFLLIGADGTNCGTFSGSRYGTATAEIKEKYLTAKERNNEYIKLSIQWYIERGIMGNFKFIMEKLDAAYNDGKFNDVQFYDKSTVKRNLVYEIYSNDGRLYPFLSELLQLLWFFILGCISYGTMKDIKKRDKQYNTIKCLFEIILLGVTAYIMIFENRSKYLFMFLPIYIILAMLHLYKSIASESDEIENIIR